MTQPPVRNQLFSRPSWSETTALKDALRTETVGGALLLGAAMVALIWANSPWHESYAALRAYEVGVDWGHLKLSLGHWAGDGLLAIFFFVAGLELKREFLVGDLKDRTRAAVPIVAAFCGVIMPAVVFLLVVKVGGAGGDATRGWAIPSATDIAFALAVLAILGSHLPSGLRSFLLTLAVVDDLIAIVIIAIGYTSDFSGTKLLLALIPLTAFTGVAGEGASVGIERDAAGVRVVGGEAGAAWADPVLWGVIAGLVVGKVIGVLGGTYLAARFTKAHLDPQLSRTDIFGLSLLTGIGFTVSLLIGELAYGTGSPRDDHVKLAVLCGSLIAALLAAIVLVPRNAYYRAQEARELADSDQDGIPDVYETEAAEGGGGEQSTGREPLS